MASGQNRTSVTLEELTDEEKKTVNKNYGELSTDKDLLRTVPRSVTLSRSFVMNMERLMTNLTRPSDVWIVTLPNKAG